MRRSEGTFLLEFCVAVPWIVIAAVLVGSSAKHILPDRGTPAPPPARRMVEKIREPAQADAQPALAPASPLHADGKDRHRRKKSAPAMGRKEDSNHPPYATVGTLKALQDVPAGSDLAKR